jgi:5-methylcytosine-specific restriction endonuclease McrA
MSGMKNWNKSYKGAVASAKSRGTPLYLTQEQWEIKTKYCSYCGDFIQEKSGTKLDRIDNSFGYTDENTVGCCRQCNVAKNNYTLEEFKHWIATVHNNFQNEPTSTQDWNSIWEKE